MKKKFGFYLIVLSVLILSGCQETTDPDDLRNNVIDKIGFYVEANQYIEKINDESLENVEESLSYTASDFFNYDSKSTNNVELEYNDYYEAFGQLLFVKNAIENIEDFEYDMYFEDVITNETVYVNIEDGLLHIEYFEYSNSVIDFNLY